MGNPREERYNERGERKNREAAGDSMIQNPKTLRTFEREQIARTAPDPEANFRIAEALYDEAVAMGIFPPADPLEGIDVDIRIARAVNLV